ncbi:MAG: transglutaminase domain protein, partial [Solirubrobacterales bacterium]|nr:transglutaminase domain protein [Solirubrobacterales bacterium]
LVLLAAIAIAVAAGAHRAAELSRRRRIGTLAAIGVAALLALLLASGVPLGLLRPGYWGELAAGLGQGIQSLPTIGVPYRGVDPWIRIVLLAGGGLLLGLAGLLAARALRRDRRPLAAAIVLATAYVIPIVEHSPSHPFAWGIVFTVLSGALLWADRIERGYAAAAGAFVVVAVAGALVASPQLDAAKPWVDYQAIVESLSTPPSIGFNWEHGYGPLNWPRENRIMLRVASDRPHYWKTVDLDTFDGTAWTTEPTPIPTEAPEQARNHADWTIDLRVTVRDLRTPYYVATGTGLKIENSPRFALPSSPGTFATGGEPLRRGDSYTAQAYAPNPSVRELRTAGTEYPPLVSQFLTMELPPDVGGPATAPGAPSSLAAARVEFPQYSVLSARNPPMSTDAEGRVSFNATPLLQHSEYAQMFALARRLRLRSTTPYALVRAVQARLAGDYAYTEKPPAPKPGRPPLVSFLFDTHAGYCQHFSGAMALLLRMGGVPARVSSGFSPGTFDAGRDEWVVRDVDAHSWVEVYFPHLGWITFDPTPGIAPPRTQLVNGPAPLNAKEIPLRPEGRQEDAPPRAGAGGGISAGSSGTSGWAVAGIVALIAGAALLGVLVVRRRRRRPARGPAELAELERALHLTGRSIEPRLTLQALEERFRRQSPAAAAYVAAVRLERFGGSDRRPTREQRSALRAELAAGLGMRGRIRAWMALPPAWQRP